MAITIREPVMLDAIDISCHVVKKYYTTDTDKDDLISIGTIGLIKGISSFKPQKGVKLARKKENIRSERGLCTKSITKF